MPEPKTDRHKNLAETAGTDAFTARIKQISDQYPQPDPKELKFVGWLANVGLLLLALGVLAIIFLAPDSTSFKEIINVGATGITIAGLGFALMSVGYSSVLSMKSENSAKDSTAALQQSLITVSLQVSALHDALNKRCYSCDREAADVQDQDGPDASLPAANVVPGTKTGLVRSYLDGTIRGFLRRFL